MAEREGGAGGAEQVSADILRLMLDGARDAIYAVALPEARMLHATPAFPRRLGLPPDFLERGFVFSQYMEHVHPDDRQRVRGIMDQVLNSRSDAELPENPARYRTGPRQGPWRHIEDHFRVLRRADGSPSMIIGNSRDATEVVEARQALRESESLLRLMADSSPDLFFIIRLPEFSFEYASPSYGTLTGYTPQQHYDDPLGVMFAVIAPGWRDQVARWMEEIRRGNVEPTYEYEILDRQGGRRWLLQRQVLVPAPDGRGMLMQGVATDITELREAQRHLRQNEARFRLLAENSRDIFFTMRFPEGVYEYINPRIAELCGHTPQQFYDDPGTMLRCVPEDWHPTIRGWLAEIAAGKVRDSYEFPVLDSQGNIRWIEERLALTPAPDGRGMLLQGVGHDKTEERNAREALRESEARFRLLIEAWPDHVTFSLNTATGHYEYVSPSVENLLGHAPDDFRDDPGLGLALVAPHWREQVRAWMEENRQGVIRPSYEYEMLRKDGRTVWVHQAGVLLPRAPGRDLTALFAVRDITEERRAREALRASEAHFRQLIEAWPDQVVLSVNLDAGRHEYVSPSMERVLGYAPQEFYDDPGLGLRVVAPQWRQEADAWLDELRRGIARPSFDFELVRKDGRAIWVQQVCAIQPREPGQDLVVQFAFRDITEERNAREALRQSEERFRQLTESWTDQVLFRIDLATMRREYVSPSVERVLGYTPEQFYRGDPQALGAVAPEWQDAVQEWVEENRRGIIRPQYEYEVFDAQGNRKWMHQRGVLLRDAEGRPVAVQFLMHDITVRKRLEQALAASELKYRSLHESMRDGFAAVDERGFIVEHNASFRDMLGYSDEEIGRLTYRDITPEAWHEVEARTLEEQVLVRGYSDPYEKEYRRRDGSVFPVSIRTYASPAEAGKTRMWAIVRDISAQKRAEEELRRSQAFLDCVIEQSPVSMWVSDERGTLIRTNQALRALFKVSDAEVMGLYNVFEDAQLIELGIAPRIRRIFEQGGTVRFMLPYATGRIDSLRLAQTTSAFLDVTISAVQDDQGRTTNLIVQHVDISEQKRAEDELRRKDALLSAMLRNLPFDFWARDLNLQSIMQSDESVRLWGDLGAGPGAEQHIHAETRAVWLETDRKVLEQSPLSEERTLKLPSGEERAFHSVVAQIRDGDTVLGLLGVNIDITERRATEEAMRLLNARYSLLAANVADVIWTTDADLRWTFLTPSAERLSGIPMDRLMAMRFDELFTPRSMRAVGQAMALRRQELTEGLPLVTHTLEMELIRADGSLVPLEVIVQPLFGPDGELAGYCGTSRDITQRKQAEEALQRSERRFSELIRNSSDSITILDAQGTQIFVSEAVERMLGYKPEELMGIPVIDRMLHPEDQERVREGFATILREGKGGAQYRHRHKDGHWVHLEAWGTNQLDNPDIRGVVVNVRDITDRKRAEEALEKNERMLRRLLESMHEGVWAFDADLRTIFLNERMSAMLGYPPEELAAIGPVGVTDASQHGLVEDRLAERQRGISGSTDYTLVRKDGTRFPAQIMSSPIMDDQGRFQGLICGVVDLTRRERLEREVRRNQARLETLYELSRLTGATEAQIAAFTLTQALKLSGSASGVLFFVSADGQTLEPRAWEGEAGQGAAPRFPAGSEAPWGQVARTGAPLTLNEVRPEDLHLPPGHPPVLRFLGVPALDGGRTVAVLGLTNKAEPYDEADALQLTLLVDGMWRIVRARRDDLSIRASLREKEALLREVHHRVKNNLQVVSSLLDMSGRRLSEPEARQAMAEVQAKVQAMSLIHILLYGAGDGRGIQLGEYVGALFRQLREIYSGGGAGLTLSARLHLGGLVLGLDQAVPLGLALNEALANVFKHAAAEGVGGADGSGQSVEVRAEYEADGLVALTVRDHGPGLPPGMDPRRSGGLGMRLMQGLVVHQLGGSFTIGNAPDGGVLVTLRFRPAVDPGPSAPA